MRSEGRSRVHPERAEQIEALLVRLVLEGAGEHEEGAAAGDADDDEERHPVPHVPVVVEAPSARGVDFVCAATDSLHRSPPTAVLRRAQSMREKGIGWQMGRACD